MSRQLIVGAGTIGSALATRLAEQAHDVVVVSRRGTAPMVHGVTGVALDATDVESLAALARGADVIYNCANPSYHRWATDWPPLAASLFSAAERSGAVLVTLSNLYGYGPVPHAMVETDPLAATSRKGRVRAAMWLDARAAHEAGRVRATEVRASDYFGPGITSTGMLGERVVPRILDHRSIVLPGNLDAPHSWTFVDDVVSALEIAGRDLRAWGRAWHVPTAAPASVRTMVHGFARAAGLDAPAVRRLPWGVLGAAGLVVADIREIREISYQLDAPFVVDSSDFCATFDVRATDLDAALRSTVEWWRRRRGFPLPSSRHAMASG
ncbi:MAG TPA: NAD-dependent epimerase/dehydratase family protein [Acidimicrobiales bacterium]|nr:NAD-dependent epimerase/dehydratase family protein [Acidimicrobiales bacterium]